MQPDLAAERKEENIRTKLQTFQAALDNYCWNMLVNYIP
jgi:hypothetical protein